MVEFKLPDIGEGMHEGEIIKWFVKEGELVQQDQPVVEIQTDKVTAELSAPTTGMIAKIFFLEGDTVEVGKTLFTIQTEKEPPPQAEPSLEDRRVLATPYVRQLARELSIKVEDVTGTGPAGRITESDVRKFTEVPKPANLEPATLVEKEERIPMKGIRKKIADHMVKSVSIIPHVTHVDELEMDALKALRDQLKMYAEEKNIKLTFFPFLIKAIVAALKEFKTLNASIDDHTNEIVLKNYYHIGIATDTPDGLIVPVIKNADKKSILELAEEISSLATRAKEGKLTLTEVTDSTFTISNVGPIGGLYATPIINHPEVAILAFHKMEPRMVVRDSEGVIRLMMNMSLSFDHRLIDGVTAVKFTNRIKKLLESPNLLFLEMR
ncbi:MAG TPA: 2-oxo acid dehydrogenase subunit E2 [Bacillales bacterium]|nr:2-oxo acid dehydrogenase subunit E2 [Bacillales bacterium]